MVAARSASTAAPSRRPTRSSPEGSRKLTSRMAGIVPLAAANAVGEDGLIAGATDEPGRKGSSRPKKLAILLAALLLAVAAFAVSLLLAILVTGLLTDPSKPHSQSVVVAELVVVIELIWFVAAFSIAWKMLAAQSGWKLPRFWTLTGGLLLV